MTQDEEIELVRSLRDIQSLEKLTLELTCSSSQAKIVEALSTVLPYFLSHSFRSEEMHLFCEGLHANQLIVKLSLSGGHVRGICGVYADAKRNWYEMHHLPISVSYSSV
jgi:hypothetical protein